MLHEFGHEISGGCKMGKVHLTGECNSEKYVVSTAFKAATLWVVG
jgi:hypothetical protein